MSDTRGCLDLLCSGEPVAWRATAPRPLSPAMQSRSLSTQPSAQPDDILEWHTPLLATCLAHPRACCCPCCTAHSQRKSVLKGRFDFYQCCQGYGSCTCLEGTACVDCRAELAPIMLCCEAFCCCCSAAYGSREFLREGKGLRHDRCDNRIMRCNNCVEHCVCGLLLMWCTCGLCWSTPADKKHYAALLAAHSPDRNLVGDLLYNCTAPCQMAQLAVEMRLQPTPPLPKPADNKVAVDGVAEQSVQRETPSRTPGYLASRFANKVYPSPSGRERPQIRRLQTHVERDAAVVVSQPRWQAHLWDTSSDETPTIVELPPSRVLLPRSMVFEQLGYRPPAPPAASPLPPVTHVTPASLHNGSAGRRPRGATGSSPHLEPTSPLRAYPHLSRTQPQRDENVVDADDDFDTRGPWVPSTPVPLLARDVHVRARSRAQPHAQPSSATHGTSPHSGHVDDVADEATPAGHSSSHFEARARLQPLTPVEKAAAKAVAAVDPEDYAVMAMLDKAKQRGDALRDGRLEPTREASARALAHTVDGHHAQAAGRHGDDPNIAPSVTVSKGVVTAVSRSALRSGTARPTSPPSRLAFRDDDAAPSSSHNKVSPPKALAPTAVAVAKKQRAWDDYKTGPPASHLHGTA